jgi:signal transduction histidine kinase
LDDQFVVFQVQDTGVGIESDAIPRIFERFYKADSRVLGAEPGLGFP